MSSACDGRFPKWQRRPEARHGEIIEAAILAFGELGYQRATLADVARRAGVCPGTVAHYFGSKGALFEAAIATRFGQFLAAEEAALATSGGPAWPRLERLLHDLWNHAWRPGTLELLRLVRVNVAEFPESAQLLRREMGERWRRLIVTVLEEGMQSGEFRRLDADLASYTIGHAFIGVADNVAAFTPYDADMPAPEALWEALMDMVSRWVHESEQAETPGRRSRNALRRSGPGAGEAV